MCKEGQYVTVVETDYCKYPLPFSDSHPYFSVLNVLLQNPC